MLHVRTGAKRYKRHRNYSHVRILAIVASRGCCLEKAADFPYRHAEADCEGGARDMLFTEAKVLKVPYWKTPSPGMRADSALGPAGMEPPCAATFFRCMLPTPIWDRTSPLCLSASPPCCCARSARCGDLQMSHGHRGSILQALWSRTPFLIRSSLFGGNPCPQDVIRETIQG